MKFTDISEAGLERIIVKSLMEEAGYQPGKPSDYDRSHAVDLVKLTSFIQATQPEIAERLCLEEDCPIRTQFLHRLQGEVAKRGIIDVLRKGIKHGPDSITLFYGSPTANNEKARELFGQNIFSVTRQLRYSGNETQLALDMGIFISGRKPEPELDQLSNIIKTFNDLLGNINWKDADGIEKVITGEIPGKVAADTAYQNAMKNSDKQNARIEHDNALGRVMVELIADHTELLKQFSDNPSFKKWLGDTIFGVTYSQSETEPAN